MRTLLRSQRLTRRVFWCPVAGRFVGVEFVEEGFPGLRRRVEVRSCAAFEDPSQINCRRQCLEPYLFPRSPLEAMTKEG